MRVVVYSKRFGDEAAARAYAFDRLPDIDPDDDPPLETALERDLDTTTDPDFVEVIFGEGRLEYLRGLLVDDEDYEEVLEQVGRRHDTLLLILDADGANEAIAMADHDEHRIGFVGDFLCRLPDP